MGKRVQSGVVQQGALFGILAILLLLASCSKKENNYYISYPIYEGTVKDADSNVYRTVYIQGQTWMVQNLKTTRYSDGTPIPKVEDPGTWAGIMTPAYSDYGNDSGQAAVYGHIYNGHAVIRAKLCPYPFHIPYDHDWQQLVDTLGGAGTAGGKLKEAGTAHWQNNFGATNQFGFKGLPGGMRSAGGEFGGLGLHGYWWGNPVSLNYLLVRMLHFDNTTIDKAGSDLNTGYSVRCVRDF